MISRHTVKNLIRSILLTSKASRILAFSIALAVIGLSFAVPQAQAVQYDRTKISAEWSMSQRYQLHPDASQALISQPQITWYGINAQNQKVPLRVNDTIVDGRATYRIAGFYYGIVDVNSNEGVWDCEGVRCSEFDVTVPPLGAFDGQPYHSSNPYPTGSFERISLDDFSKIPLNELTTHIPRYKVIPAIYGVIEGVTRPKGIYSDSGS
ncbi:MAG TPA: hypothetical protein VEA37_03815, partial [Flavobacterium sp.]|nr:hypothetical protein [Flavobacterium sp.]